MKQNSLLNEIFGDLQEAAIDMKDKIFFVEDNIQGYFSKVDFVNYLRNAKRHNKIYHLKQLFDSLCAGRKLSNFPQIAEEDGIQTTWCTFKSGNVKQSLNIYLEGRMFDFIKDYAEGKFKFPFTLETLIEQAESLNVPSTN